MFLRARKRFLLLLLIAGTATLISTPAQQGHMRVDLKPENKELTLGGIVREIHGYGPPGYGEDKKRDSRITYWALELPTRINLLCTPEKPEWASTDCRSEK